MLIDLEKAALERIVMEGIREMIYHIAGKNKHNNKKAWFKAMRAEIKEYEKKFLEEFLPVLLNDFGKDIVVKFSGGTMSEEDIEKLKVFMKMLERSNCKKLLEDLLRKLGEVKIDETNTELKKKIRDIGDIH